MTPQEKVYFNWNNEDVLKKCIAEPGIKADTSLYKKVQNRLMDLVLYRVNKNPKVPKKIPKIEVEEVKDKQGEKRSMLIERRNDVSLEYDEVKPMYDKIAKKVATVTGVSLEDIISASRVKHIFNARQLLILKLNQCYPNEYYIARYVNRSRCGIRHAYESVEIWFGIRDRQFMKMVRNYEDYNKQTGEGSRGVILAS